MVALRQNPRDLIESALDDLSDARTLLKKHARAKGEADYHGNLVNSVMDTLNVVLADMGTDGEDLMATGHKEASKA